MQKKNALKEQFDVTIREYLQQAEWHKWDDAFELSKDGSYRFLGFQFDNYHVDVDSAKYSILVKASAWDLLIEQVYRLFQGKVRSKLLNSTLGDAIRHQVDYPKCIH